MAPSKCNFTVFSKGDKNKFEFEMFGQKIPYEKTPVSLGIMFDEHLNFKAHVNRLKANCDSRLNIIKILSHKSWKLSPKTLTSIYRCLIGSVLDYSAFIGPRLTEKVAGSVQVVQNTGMRSIFHRRYDEHTEELCRLSGLPLVQERMSELNVKYFENAERYSNPLIADLFESFRRTWPGGHGPRPGIKTLLCDHEDVF